MSTAMGEIRYAYDPQSAETRFMHKHVYGQWRSLTEMFAIAVMLVFLYFIVKIAVREYAGQFAALHPALLKLAPLVFWAGIVLGLAAAYFCGLLVDRLHQTLTDVENESTLFNKGPIDVVLDKDGVHSTTPYMAQFVKWDSVSAVVKTPQGIGLRLDRTHFVPIIDIALPEGVTRDDVLASIEGWRGSLK